MRAGIRATLEQAGFVVCAEAATAESAIDAALRERPGITLLDVQMPGSGIAAAAEISARLPETLVIMLTVSEEDEDLFDALQAGAFGYLLKDTLRTELPAALESALAGEAPLSPSLVGRLIGEFRHRAKRRRLLLARRPGVELSKREWEVLELLREGLSTAQIASRLFVSEVTVRSHVASALKKLHVSSRAEALRLLEER